MAVPFAKAENNLSVALADPRDFFVLEDINLRTGLNIIPFLALPQDILALIDQVYGRNESAVMSMTVC